MSECKTEMASSRMCEHGTAGCVVRHTSELAPARGSVCPVANAVALQVLKRAEAGMKKYGVNATRKDLSTIQWLQHLQEELLDAAVYIERLKQESTLNS